MKLNIYVYFIPIFGLCILQGEILTVRKTETEYWYKLIYKSSENAKPELSILLIECNFWYGITQSHLDMFNYFMLKIINFIFKQKKKQKLIALQDQISNKHIHVFSCYHSIHNLFCTISASCNFILLLWIYSTGS